MPDGDSRAPREPAHAVVSWIEITRQVGQRKAKIFADRIYLDKTYIFSCNGHSARYLGAKVDLLPLYFTASS